ncbi:MAG: peptide chain release factor N(5)-glutamine methyltransferase [Ruminococcus sp.]|nr:peptide chain release factor N(5)-glutamine methyltransferase [Ruminococcus sp.]
MTFEQTYKSGIEYLINAGVADAKLDAWYLLEHVTGMSRALYFTHTEDEMEKDQEEAYFELIKKRGQRIPLQHLTGVQEFMGLEFDVNEHVLIPRQDTEILVEEAIDTLKEKVIPAYVEEGKTLRMLDLCTGSGCIIITLLRWLEKTGVKMEGIGVDISDKALEVAVKNVEKLKYNAKMIKSDLFENVSGKYELIISNPPYIRTAMIESLEKEVKCHDPYLALDGKEDGLHFYREIIKESVDYITPGGYLMFEIGCDQAKEVTAMMKEAGYKDVTVKKDLSGLDRVVFGMYDGKVKK